MCSHVRVTLTRFGRSLFLVKACLVAGHSSPRAHVASRSYGDGIDRLSYGEIFLLHSVGKVVASLKAFNEPNTCVRTVAVLS